jgi:hypothetical protein
MMDYDEIGRHGHPRDMTACPACGLQYGHHGRKVCSICCECSKCCRCDEPEHLGVPDDKKGFDDLMDLLDDPILAQKPASPHDHQRGLDF